MQAYMAIESPKQIGDCRESPMPDLFVKAVPEFPIVVGTDPNVGFGERFHMTIHHYDVAFPTMTKHYNIGFGVVVHSAYRIQ